MYIHTTEISRHIYIVVLLRGFFDPKSWMGRTTVALWQKGCRDFDNEFDSANMMHKLDKKFMHPKHNLWYPKILGTAKAIGICLIYHFLPPFIIN